MSFMSVDNYPQIPLGDFPPFQEVPVPYWDTVCKMTSFILTPLSWCSSRFNFMIEDRSFAPEPPSAKGHALLGSLPEFIKMDYDIFRLLTVYQERFGKLGICKLTVGFKTFYIVTDPKLAREVLSDFHRYPRKIAEWEEFSKGGLSEGKETDDFRQQANRAIGQGHFSYFFGPIQNVAREWVHRLREGTIDIMQELERGTLSALGESLFKINPHDPHEPNPFSPKEDNDDDCIKLLEAFHSIFDLMTHRFSSSMASVPLVGNSLYSFKYSKEERDLTEAKEVLFSILRPIYESLLRNPEDIPQNSHFYQLMQNFKIDIKNPDYEQILENSLGFLQAAFETSSKALGWILHTLTLDPETQTQLRKDLKKSFGKIRPQSYEDLKNIPLLHQTIEEALRICPPLPFAMRTSRSTVVLSNQYKIRKGATIIICPIFINRNIEYWKNPNDFNPKRFTAERRKDSWQVMNPQYGTFAGGGHRCPGRHFAKQELAILLAEILFNFRVEATAPPPQFKFNITLQPKTPINIKFISDPLILN